MDDRREAEECAFVRLRGATERLLLVLNYRSERNFGAAIKAVKILADEYIEASKAARHAHTQTSTQETP